MQNRAAKAGAAVGASTATPAPARPRTSPSQFFREVRAEARKITWPSRQETWITSVMVFIMVLVASAFFGGLDTVLGFSIKQILSRLT
ncbi:MAG: preprotein translocase, SecE subunit [Caulobacteraceae bacterium]|nr:preprotein translocase, SecE subunit [Caulobacteraceae bacterium]